MPSDIQNFRFIQQKIMIEGDGKTFAVSFVMHMEETVGVRSLQAAMYPKEAVCDGFCR
jgi:hypothetical protein